MRAALLRYLSLLSLESLCNSRLESDVEVKNKPTLKLCSARLLINRGESVSLISVSKVYKVTAAALGPPSLKLVEIWMSDAHCAATKTVNQPVGAVENVRHKRVDQDHRRVNHVHRRLHHDHKVHRRIHHSKVTQILLVIAIERVV